MSENEKDFGIISHVDVSNWGIQDMLVNVNGPINGEEQMSESTREQFIKAMALDGWTPVLKTSAFMGIEYIAEWKHGQGDDTITETNAAAQMHWLETGSTPPPF